MSDKKPLISIVIPAYQHAVELPKCLDTVLSQTIQNTEVIVVNDGSTDDTIERLKPYEGRITLINQENRGGNAARNRGAAEATGEFVMFCDADLIMRVDCLETLLGALRENPEAAYAYPDFAMGLKSFEGVEYDAEYLKSRNFIHTSALIRRSSFPGFDESVRKLQDWDLWLTMAERGEGGVHVPERLFKCIPHKGGISTWMPSLLYSVPWRKFGVKIKPLEKYWAAEAKLREKHELAPYESMPRLPASPMRVFRLSLLAFLLLELVSFVGYRLPLIGAVAFGLAMILAAAIAWLRPDIGFLLVMAELLAGSQGGYLLALPLGGAALSLRMALFVVVFAAWFARSIGELVSSGWKLDSLDWLARLRRHRIWWPYFAFLAVVGGGFGLGLLRGNRFDNIFFDANGYFFLALLPAFVAAWRPNSLRRLFAVVSAGLTVAVLKSLFILYIFSHRLFDFAPTVYTWVRDTRVGEITLMGADYYRIFFQSQVFALSAGLIAMVAVLFAYRWRWRLRHLWVFGLASVAMVLSLSRSFWFGAFCAGLAAAAVLTWSRASWRVWQRFLVPLTAVAVMSFVVIGAVYAFPWPGRFGTSDGFRSVLSGRMSMTGDDAASRSRWALLKQLDEAAMVHPVIGSGLGTTVTYKTSDPRMVTMTGDGVYTTYAFEWGYHDLFIKFGALGLLIVFWFLWRVMKPAVLAVWRRRDFLKSPQSGLATEQRQAALALGVMLSMVALLATNIFSPYLNHPLGLGLIMTMVAMVVHSEIRAKVG